MLHSVDILRFITLRHLTFCYNYKYVLSWMSVPCNMTIYCSLYLPPIQFILQISSHFKNWIKTPAK